jgi:hypothetical protein
MGSALPKKAGLEVSVGDVRELIGAEDAIVPPTPALDIAGSTDGAGLPVMEYGFRVIEVVEATIGRLCGDGIPMTKGVLLAVDPVLMFRCGEERWVFAVLELADPARGRGEKGERMPVYEPRGRWLNGVGESEVLREWARSGELRIASAKTSMRGGVENPIARSAGDSYNPYCGRGGRSGISFHLFGSGSEDDRPRFSPGCPSSSSGMS